LNREALALYRPALECQLQGVLDNPLVGGGLPMHNDWLTDLQQFSGK